MDISDLITRYNPAPSIQLNQTRGLKKRPSQKPPQKPPPKKLPSNTPDVSDFHQYYRKQSSLKTHTLEPTHKTEPSPTTKINPHKVNRYVESVRRKKTRPNTLTKRQRVNFQGKKQMKVIERNTSRIDKHMECANTKVLRKLLRTKDIKTTRKTPPQLVDRLSKLMIGSKIRIRRQ